MKNYKVFAIAFIVLLLAACGNGDDGSDDVSAGSAVLFVEAVVSAALFVANLRLISKLSAIESNETVESVKDIESKKERTVKRNGFGSQWDEMELPIKAKVGVVDSGRGIGLSAMQLRNIGWSGKYHAVRLKCGDRTATASVYNAFGIQGMDGNEVRISAGLSCRLRCDEGDEIVIEGLE